MSASGRRALVDRGASLSIRRQCVLLGVARSSVYRVPRPANDNDLLLMRRIDERYTAWPFLGSRRMTALLRAERHRINRRPVQRLMRWIGIAALGPKLRTTKPAPGHKIFPYLLRNLVIDRPNQVWAADITYAPTGRGFLYLDSVLIERLWRSLKYEDIYLKGYADGRDARARIAEWLAFFNHRRPHQALANRTPMAVWRNVAGGALGAQRLWIGRCAWTTLAGRPHTHSRSNSKHLSLDDFSGSERRRFQLTARHQWSRERGPLQASGLEPHAASRKPDLAERE
jgi:Integrase core domain/HTH-like domain